MDRELPPDVLAWAREMRDAFGPGVRLRYVRWPDGEQRGLPGKRGVSIADSALWSDVLAEGPPRPAGASRGRR